MMTATTTTLGRTALVTGASGGIGSEFARQLAERGHDLVLSGRDVGVLDRLAERLRREHGVDIDVVVADLATPGGARRLVTDLGDRRIDVLVSNAGAAAMGALLAVDPDRLEAMLRLNTTAHLLLVRALAPQMVARGHGGVVLVGSTAGLQATPYGANYSGAKAYLHNLGAALHDELRGTGVHVSVLVPGPTDTPALTHRDDIDLNGLPAPVQTTGALVRTGLRGLERNRALVVSGPANRLTDWLGRRVLGHSGSRALWRTMMERNLPDALRTPTPGAHTVR